MYCLYNHGENGGCEFNIETKEDTMAAAKATKANPFSQMAKTAIATDKPYPLDLH